MELRAVTLLLDAPTRARLAEIRADIARREGITPSQAAVLRALLAEGIAARTAGTRAA